MNVNAISKTVAIFGAVCIVSILLLAGWMISGSWVTPPEKDAMRKALPEVQGIRNFHEDSEAYRAQVDKAKLAVGFCKKSAITEYDGRMVWALQQDLDAAVSDSKSWRMPDTPEKRHYLKVQDEEARFMDSLISSHLN